MLNYGAVPYKTDQEIDELIRSYDNQKLSDLRTDAEPGTEWRRLLDAEVSRRGLPEGEQ